MTKMNLSMKQNQTHGDREQTCGCQEGSREGWSGMLELAEANYYIYNG